MPKAYGRPKKMEAEKLNESIFMRLSKANYDAFAKIAFSRRLPISLLILTLLAENKSFEKKVSDEEYEDLLKRPEAMQNVSQNTRKEDRRVVVCRMTKEDKKSLTYKAVIGERCSPNVLMNRVIIDRINHSAENKK